MWGESQFLGRRVLEMVITVNGPFVAGKEGEGVGERGEGQDVSLGGRGVVKVAA